jgi:hypothetical protein
VPLRIITIFVSATPTFRFSPWAWDAQRHTYRATSPQILGGCAPVRDLGSVAPCAITVIKPLTCQGGVGDRLLSPTGRESRGRGLPLPFGAVRHIFIRSPNLTTEINPLAAVASPHEPDGRTNGLGHGQGGESYDETGHWDYLP